MAIENWGPIIIAILVLTVMGAITIFAIRKYPFDQVLKLWQAQVAVFGVMIGAMTAHFYGAGARNQAIADRKRAFAERDQLVSKLETVSSERDEYQSSFEIASAECAEVQDDLARTTAQLRMARSADGTPEKSWLEVLGNLTAYTQYPTVDGQD